MNTASPRLRPCSWQQHAHTITTPNPTPFLAPASPQHPHVPTYSRAHIHPAPLHSHATQAACSPTILAAGMPLRLVLLGVVPHARSTRAHRWIIGYICHELRNPMHVLKAALVTMLERQERQDRSPARSPRSRSPARSPRSRPRSPAVTRSRRGSPGLVGEASEGLVVRGAVDAGKRGSEHVVCRRVG